MRGGKTIAVVIPALNEAESIGAVLADVPRWVDRVVVADNASTDATAAIAQAAGAEVVACAQRGYGAACLAALTELAEEPPQIVVFLDGDYSDYPEEMDRLVDPILHDGAQLVIGSRVERAAPGSLTIVQRFGNLLATRLIRLIWRVDYSDLGPFRALDWPTLVALELSDQDFGWTVEMQVKAAKQGVGTLCVPVGYRPRIGQSKISGTVRGSFLAGRKILGTIAREALS